MAAYAEGLNILRHANVGKRARAVDAETTPLRNPEHYQYDLDLADIAEVWRRGSVIASWLLDLTAAALARRSDARGLRRTGVGLRRGALDARRRHRRRRCRRTCSPPRCSSASARAARPTSRTGCSRRCASSSAATSRRDRGTMSAPRSDALVFFGATGDLAFKKIFPALHAMVRRGHLDVPGHRRRAVAAGRSSSSERAPARASSSTAAASTRRPSQKLASAAALRRAATTRTRRRSPTLRKELGDATRPLHYLAIPPSLFATVVEGLGAVGLRARRARGPREAVRPRPRLGARR